jgi:hypothetical protein
VSRRRGQLLGTFALLGATAAALALGAIGREAREAAAAPEHEDRSLARLSVAVTPTVARRVERLRGLSFDGLPDPEVISTTRLSRITRREQRRAGAVEGLPSDQATVRMLGLLGPDERLAEASTAGSDLAAAAYDTRRDRLYVIRDAVSANRALVEFVLAHELTHAVEDANFDLAEPDGRSDDRALAELALGEGTATAVMVDYAAGYLSPAELLAATAGVDDDTKGVPQFVVDQLEWAYLGGQRFVDALRDLARGWKLVDYAIRSRPPISTEQVLHPAKYVYDQRPLPVAIGAGELRRRGWRPADAGDAGEFATGQLLELGVDGETARRAAAGWGGDRYELWRRGVAPGQCGEDCRRDLVLIIRWRWDTPSDERQFAAAARGYVREGLDGDPAGAGTWKLQGGAAALSKGREATALALAPGVRLARVVASDANRGGRR